MSALALQEIQYSAEQFFADMTQSQRDGVGQAQWQSLRALEEQYSDKRLTECKPTCKFSDDIWQLSGKVRINWKLWKENYTDQYPLYLLCKIAAYYRIQIIKKNGQAFSSYGPKFMSIIGTGMKAEGILTASFNQPFVPASVITKEKINRWVIAAIDRGDIVSPNANNTLDLLTRVMDTPVHFFETANMLHIDAELPWTDIKASSIEKMKSKAYLANILGVDIQDLKAKSYQAFSEDVIAGVLTPAVNLIEKAAPLLKEAFDIAADRESYQKVNKFIFRSEKRDALAEIHRKLEVIAPNWPWQKTCTYNMNKKTIETWYNLAQGASLWILMLTTALRNIDIRENVFRDCFVPDGDSNLVFYLLSDIQKTKNKDHIVPVPEITTKVVNYLKNTNYAPSSVPQLVVRRTKFGEKGSASSWTYLDGHKVNALLRFWATFCGVNVLNGLTEDDNQEGMAHRCRATMAGWIGTNSPLAVLIVKRLFGHTNGIMPDHYLRSNPHVKKVREEIRIKTQTDYSEKMSDAIVGGKFSGGVKDSLVKGREYLKDLINKEASRDNESLTEGEIRKRLKDRIQFILLNKLKSGEMLALQTPLAFVCTRNVASSVDAPCAINNAKKQRKMQDIDKTFAAALQMSGLPDLDNCKGVSCPHSFLYDNGIARILLEQFKYYASYLKGIRHTDIDLDKEAKTFISLYTEPLADVYPEVIQSLDSEAKNE